MLAVPTSEPVHCEGLVPGAVGNAALGDIHRIPRGDADDSRHLPSADCRLQEHVGAIFQERDFVDEIDEGNMPPIQIRRPVIVGDAVGVGNVIQVPNVICAGSRVIRLGEGVCGLEREVPRHLRPELRLQRVVVPVLHGFRLLDGVEPEKWD